MIGMIRFDFRGVIAEAVLGNDGCWSCAAVPCLVHPLDILHSPNWDGRPAGRRHLDEAACWLKGAVVFGDSGPISGMARGSVAGGRADPDDRRSRDLTLCSARRSDRLTDRAAAEICWVDPRMIRLWVETGAWPIPRRDGVAPSTFGLSEVEGWLATGVWPAGAHFHAPPEDGASPTLIARTSRSTESMRREQTRKARPPPTRGRGVHASSGTFQ
jgi:hypothetical protein